jgi:hypothetical protein
MRAASFLLFGWLAMSQVACAPVDVKHAVQGRWESVDSPRLRCEFTEDETVRLSGEFGQVVGTYTVEDDGCIRLHLAYDPATDFPACAVATLRWDGLTLQAPEGWQARLRRK